MGSYEVVVSVHSRFEALATFNGVGSFAADFLVTIQYNAYRKKMHVDERNFSNVFYLFCALASTGEIVYDRVTMHVFL